MQYEEFLKKGIQSRIEYKILSRMRAKPEYNEFIKKYESIQLKEVKHIDEEEGSGSRRRI